MITTPLDSATLDSKEQYYGPCTNKAIIKRVVRNLILSFEKLGETQKVDEMKGLLDILND